MQSMQDFFRPVDPFSLQPAWAVKKFATQYAVLALRPVYIPDDLMLLQRWIHANAGNINTLPPAAVARLLAHYKNILDSASGQSLILLADNKPVCQFDLQHVEDSGLYRVLPTRANDSVLYCLIPDGSLQNKIWITGLKLLLDLFFSLLDAGNVFIPAPRYPGFFVEDLQEMGFKPVEGYEYPDSGTFLLYTGKGFNRLPSKGK